MGSLSTSGFQENLLKLYLGKYESRFKLIESRMGITMCTDPHPMLVVQLNKVWVSLAEYIEIEEDDPYHGAFDYYQIDIITVPIEDPSGAKKMEKAITKSFLTGTQL